MGKKPKITSPGSQNESASSPDPKELPLVEKLAESSAVEIQTDLIIDEAVTRLNAGQVIGLPTETVYGLAARIDLPEAIKKIFITKARPFFDPLIVHVSSIEQAKNLTTCWPPAVDALAKAFWPGPLTIVMPKSAQISEVITSGLPSVGLRMPHHSIALKILKRVGVPLAAPSANKFGRTSPTTAQHVKSEFKSEDIYVVDGGACNVGIESTVLHVEVSSQSFRAKIIKSLKGSKSVSSEEKQVRLSILRKGAISKSQILQALEKFSKKFAVEFVETINKSAAPGHMKHHYMPSVPFILARDTSLQLKQLTTLVAEHFRQMPDEIEGVKIIKPKGEIKKIEFLNLSQDPTIAAREFYSKLRTVADRGPDLICMIQQKNQVGEKWEALFERITKAASLIL